MTLNLESITKNNGTEWLLEQAGYKPDVIKSMTIRETLINLTVAVLMGIAKEELNAFEIIYGVINSSAEFAEWDQTDLKIARAILTTVGGSQMLSNSKVDDRDRRQAAHYAINILPPEKGDQRLGATFKEDVIIGYAMATKKYAKLM